MLLSLVNFNFRDGLSEYGLTRVVLQAGTENFLETNTVRVLRIVGVKRSGRTADFSSASSVGFNGTPRRTSTSPHIFIGRGVQLVRRNYRFFHLKLPAKIDEPAKQQSQ